MSNKSSSALLLSAFAEGTTFHDPDIRLVNGSTNPNIKRRSQFHIAMKELETFYEKTGWNDLKGR